MNDHGDWLSAQQAVMPDGRVVDGLRLVNKKLPPLQAHPSSTVEALNKEDDQPTANQNKRNDLPDL